MVGAGIKSKLQSYGRVYGWLAADVWKSAPVRVSFIVALSVVSVTARLLAIAVVLAFAHAQSGEGSGAVAGIQVSASTGVASVLIWGAVALGLALLTAGLTYWLEWSSFRIAESYARRAVGFVLAAFEFGSGPQVPNLPLYQEEDFLRRLLSRDITMLSRAVLVLMRTAAPIVMFVFAVAYLFYVNVGLTLIAVVLLAAYVVPLFLVNRRVVQASRDREKHATSVGAGVKRFLPMLINRYGASTSRRDWNNVFHDTLPVEENFAALKDILLARKRVSFLQDVYLGLALVLALVIFSVMIADNPGSWVTFIAYLVALRFASASMKTLAGFVTSTNRYLPQNSRYVDFVRNSRKRHVELPQHQSPENESGAKTSEMEPLRTVRLRCPKPELADSEHELDLEPGESALVLDMTPLHVGTLRRWCRRLCSGASQGDRLWNSAFFLGDVSRLPGLPAGLIVAHSMKEAEGHRPRIEAVFDQFGLSDEYRAWPDGLATVLDGARENRLSRRMRYVLAMMEGILSNRPVFIVDLQNVNAQSGSFSESMSALLHDRVVLFAAPDIVESTPESVRAVAVMEERSIGLGDRAWYESIQPDLRQRWQKAMQSRHARLDDLADDLLIEEDDDE